MQTSAYTPFDVSARDRVVGLFVIGALLLFLIGFLIPFIQRFAEDEGIPYYTILDQTYGIAPESTVSLRGVIIGNVTGVAITHEGMVRVDISLSPTYEEFYTDGSVLSVDSNIGVSTILTGSALILAPGDSSNSLLPAGEYISTTTPQGIGSILEAMDIERMTTQVQDIVSNLDSITTGVAENQHRIYTSLENLEQVTASLAQISAELPGMVSAVDKSLVSLQKSMQGVDRIVAGTEKDLSATLSNAVKLTEQATRTLSETERLMQETRPALQQLPNVLVTTDVALQGITDLTDQLSRSWLLGGGGSAKTIDVRVPYAPNVHPHDDSLYSVESTAKTE